MKLQIRTNRNSGAEDYNNWMKHLQEGIKTRLYQAEKRISKPEDKSFEIIELRESNRKSEWKKGKDRLRDLLDTIKWANIQIWENKNGKKENRKKAYLSKGQNLPKERNLTNSRRWKTSNSERPTLRNIIVELWKVTKIIKVAREKRPITFKAAPLR